MAVVTPLPVRVRAPGKINLFLRVGAALGGGGHNIVTAYQAVSVYDEVTARGADDLSVSVSGSRAGDGLAAHSAGPGGAHSDETGLVLRAARLVAAHTGYTGGAHLVVDKNPPVVGGMGSAGADAAATLVACNALWGTQCDSAELELLAATLGHDVEFALTGGTALGAQRTDPLSPVLATGAFHWAVVVADAGMGNDGVFRQLDRDRARRSAQVADQPDVDRATLQALRSGDAYQLADALSNDLQAAALHLEPQLNDVLTFGIAHGALAGVVTGAGPTLAFLTADEESALDLLIAVNASGWVGVHATGPVPGARVVD